MDSFYGDGVYNLSRVFVHIVVYIRPKCIVPGMLGVTWSYVVFCGRILV